MPEKLMDLFDYWPRVLEVYVSPLSNGDEITGWQVELNLAGGKTKAFQCKWVSGALDEALEFCKKKYSK